MTHLKMLGLAAVAAIALMASAAGSASATTLEVGRVTQNSSVSVSAEAVFSSAIIARTDGSLANACCFNSLGWVTFGPYTGTSVTGPVTILSFTGCERTVTVHKSGTLHVERIFGSTDGTVSSSGAEITVGSPFGTLNCKTGSGVDIGRLTGKASGNAEIDISAVLNCGFLVPSATWKGSLRVTSPAGLGVSA